MNLNAMALEEFGETDENGLTLVASPAKPDTQGEEPRPTADQLFTNIEKNKIPSLNAEFVVIQDISDSVVDLTEIRMRLEDTEGISRDDAMAIESIVPGFMHKRMPLAGFTQSKTKTQLKQARESIDERFDAQLSTLAEATKSLASRVQKEAVDFLKTMDPMMLELQSLATCTFETILSSRTELSDALDTSLLAFTRDKRATTPTQREAIKQIVDVLPGASNMCYYLRYTEEKPIAVFEGDKIFVYGEDKVEIMGKTDFGLKYDVDPESHYVQVKTALHALFGQPLIANFENFKLAISFTVKDLDKVSGDVDQVMSSRMVQPLRAKAVAEIAADIRCKFLALSSLLALVKNLNRVAILFVDLFTQELGELAAASQDPDQKAGVTDLTNQMTMKVV